MKLFKYCRGVIRFRAYGGYFERFLNEAQSEGFQLWNIQKRNGIYYGRTRIKNYLKLARLARKCGVRLRTEQRNGLPFLLHRYRKRIGLVIGVFFFLTFLLMMQNFIWEIEVTGNNTLTTEQILSVARESGLQRGTSLIGLNLRVIQKDMEYHLPGVAWLTLNRKGSKVVIELHETEKKPDIADDQTPCNLIAKKDGVIKYMEIYEGEKMVKVKDSVCKGDLLVSGVTEDKFQQTRLLHSEGKVIAETYTEKTFSLPLETEEKKYTGMVKTRKHLNLFGFKLPLFIAVPIEGTYEKELTQEPLILFGKELPIGLEKMEYKEYQSIKKSYTNEEAEEILMKQISEFEKKELENAKIISREMVKTENNGAYVIKVDYICEEDIAQKEEIMINE